MTGSRHRSARPAALCFGITMARSRLQPTTLETQEDLDPDEVQEIQTGGYRERMQRQHSGFQGRTVGFRNRERSPDREQRPAARTS